VVNKVGGEILRLCIGNKLRILNGKLKGDRKGKFTSYQANGASTVHYAKASEDLLKSILGFQVLSLTPYSDHCPITLKLQSSCSKVQNHKTSREQTLDRREHSFATFLWKADSKDQVVDALSSPSVHDRIRFFKLFGALLFNG